MNRIVDSSSTLYSVYSGFWGGICRGIVEGILHPLEFIKIRQQTAGDSKNVYRIAMDVFKEEGFCAFYQGISSNLLRKCAQQAWNLPIIVETPKILQNYGVGDIQQQILTGFAVGSVDAFLTAPLERAKILSAWHKKGQFSLRNLNNPWQGGTSYWAKRSISMSLFLVSQHYLRERSRKHSEELSQLELTKIGVQIAVIASFAAAPFDVVNTLKQTKDWSWTSLASRKEFFKLFRGSPINAFSLIMKSVFLVSLIDRLEQSKVLIE